MVSRLEVCQLSVISCAADSYLMDRCFITTSRDMTARLFTLDPLGDFRPKTFAGHRDVVIGAYFSSDCKSVRVPLSTFVICLPTILSRYIQSAGTVPHLRGVKRRTRKKMTQMTRLPLPLHLATLAFPSRRRAGAFTNGITLVSTTPRSLVPHSTQLPTSS